VRDLQRLPAKVAPAVVEFVYSALVDSPARVGKPLRNELAGLHSARRGAYRVLYRIEAEEGVPAGERSSVAITVIAIQHRSIVYRPR
jgi:mRNA-degrading endonuclease RelE of RelBE toxin-antitoxin system